ncbi:hypothetical protein [Bradyrhizobium algeriense]
MGTRSRESIYGASVRAAAEQAAEARKTADRLACEAWNKRMLGLQGPAQPSPALGDALNAGYLYLEVKCLGCSATAALERLARDVFGGSRFDAFRTCSKFGGSYQSTWIECFNHVVTADRDKLVTANYMHWLVRDNSPTSWPTGNFNTFTAALKKYWEN